MSRLLFWLALLLLVWLALKKKFSQRGRPPPIQPGASRLPDEAEKLLRCTHCQIAFPASEAVYDLQGRVFCCREHQLAHTPS